jgi:hypothetical protein
VRDFGFAMPENIATVKTRTFEGGLVIRRTLAGDTEGEGRQTLDSHRIPKVSH